MADQYTDTDSSNQIPGSNIGTVAAILGGTLITPRILRLMGGAKSMHPATANEQGWRGALTHPDAVAEQQRLDNYIINNLGQYQTDKPSRMQIDRAHRMGWEYGPMSDFSREVSDENMVVDPDANRIIHPAGDVHSILGMGPLEWTRDPSVIARYHPIDRVIELNEDLKQGRLPQESLSDPTFGPNYPQYKALQSIAGHELQHGFQWSEGPPPRYVNFPIFDKSYEERPWENEAVGSEYRILNPSTYANIPFYDMARPEYYKYDDFLKLLKDKQ